MFLRKYTTSPISAKPTDVEGIARLGLESPEAVSLFFPALNEGGQGFF